MSIRDFRRTIGIVGIGGTGKTVLLTSLLTHLIHHDPNSDAFRLTPLKRSGVGKFFFGEEHRVAIRAVSELPAAKATDAFNFKDHLNQLYENRRWPGKTNDLSSARIRFERSDWTRALDLTFIDFPGERIADAVMGGRDFAQWSDAVLETMKSDPAYLRYAKSYFELCENADQVDEQKIISAYKRCLAALLLDYKPFVTPSVFALDTQGKMASLQEDSNNPPQDPVAYLAEKRLCGLDVENQFTPLPAALRAALPELALLFSERYEAYKKAIPQRVFSRLKKCNRLVVIMDIPGTLCAHIGRLNDVEEIFAELLNACDPGSSSMGRVGRFMSRLFIPEIWRPRGITRIAFVATKADLVLPDQVGNLEALLRGIAEQRASKISRKIVYDYFTCAAIRSTRSMEGRLFGFPVWDTNNRLLQPPEHDDPWKELDPSDLPQDWPEDWHPNQFAFPEVWPLLPRRKTKPPDQVGLDRLLDFLLTETFAE